MAEQISVTIKFFSGIDKDLGLSNYDPGKGIILQIKQGAVVKKILKQMGLKKFSGLIIFCDGKRISTGTKIKTGCEISCLKLSGGG